MNKTTLMLNHLSSSGFKTIFHPVADRLVVTKDGEPMFDGHVADCEKWFYQHLDDALEGHQKKLGTLTYNFNSMFDFEYNESPGAGSQLYCIAAAISYVVTVLMLFAAFAVSTNTEELIYLGLPALVLFIYGCINHISHIRCK